MSGDFRTVKEFVEAETQAYHCSGLPEVSFEQTIRHRWSAAWDLLIKKREEIEEILPDASQAFEDLEDVHNKLYHRPVPFYPDTSSTEGSDTDSDMDSADPSALKYHFPAYAGPRDIPPVILYRHRTKKNVEHMESQLRVLKRLYEMLQKDIMYDNAEAARLRNDLAKREKADAESECDPLEEKNQELEEENQQLEEENQQLEEDLADRDEELRIAEDDNANLKEDLAQRDQDVANRDKEIARLQEELQNQMKRSNELENARRRHLPDQSFESIEGITSPVADSVHRGMEIVTMDFLSTEDTSTNKSGRGMPSPRKRQLQDRDDDKSPAKATDSARPHRSCAMKKKKGYYADLFKEQ